MLVHNISVPFFGKYKPKKQRPGGGIPPSGQTKYFYDTAGQLVRENNETAGTTTLWTYDRAGNILTEKVYNYTTDNGTPSQPLEDNDYFYTSTKWGDLLTAYNGNMIYYDNTTTLGDFKIGNPTTYDNGTAWTFTWEHGRQLATMTSGTTTWTNTYNSDGLRTSRTNGTTAYNYYYEGSQLTEVTGSNGNVWIFYDGNRPVIIKYGDTATYHYELNLQGDVIAILDSSGNRVVEYTYDAWGKILSISGSMKDTLGKANPLCYRGYVYDNETGMYYCQSRYYDPEIGRWLNADGLVATGQGFIGNNMFVYCGNNPVNYNDTTGMCSTFLFIKFDCCKASCSSSMYYNPNAPRVVVIYDGRFSGALWGHVNSDDGFSHQGQELVNRLSYANNVAAYPYITMDDFVSCWNNLDTEFERIDEIYILGHGTPGKFNARGGSLSTADTAYTYNDLEKLNVGAIYLYICHGDTWVDGIGSTADNFANLASAPVVAIANGKLNFTWYGCYPYPSLKNWGYWTVSFPMRLD